MRTGMLIGAVLLAVGCRFSVDGVSLGEQPSGDQDGSVGGGGGGGGASLGDDAGITGGGGGGGTAPDLLMPAPADLAQPAPDLTTLPTAVGATCTGACGGGLTCMNWVAAGYCSRSCNGGNPCPGGSSCTNMGGGTSYCLISDPSGNACARSDLQCRDCGGPLVCGPANVCSGC